MEVFDQIIQGSEEWFKIRAGVITASELKNVMRSNGDASKTRRSYMLRLVGERITGEPEETYQSAHMARGNAMEAEAISHYCFTHDVKDSKRVGFIRNAKLIQGVTFGCSPDLLVGDRAGVQIKTSVPRLLIELMLKDEFPQEHRAQVQGEMWGSQRDLWDLVVYWPKMPAFVKRVYRDDNYIRRELAPAVSRFNAEVEELVERVKKYGRAA